MHLGLELPRKEQVSADLIQGVKSVHRLLDARVKINDPSGDGVIGHLGFTQASDYQSFINPYRNVLTEPEAHLIAVVHQDEEEVESTHDGSSEVHVLLQALAAVVASTNRVCSGENGGASVQSGLQETRGKPQSLKCQKGTICSDCCLNNGPCCD